MERNPFGRQVYALSAALGIWLVVAAGMLTWFDSDTAALGWALLALTTTLAVTRLFPYAGWIAACISILLYAALQVALRGLTSDAFVNIGVAAAGLVGAALLGLAVARQLSAMMRQLEHDQKLIEELSVYDPKTGLVKWQHAMQTLRTEIARSRRYQADLSLLLLRIANWEELIKELDSTEVDKLVVQISNIVAEKLRTVDIPFNVQTFGAILPETSAQGAQVVAQRLADIIAHQLRLPTHAGIASFPHDAVTEEGLVQAAEAALQFALTSGQPVVTYEQLRRITQAEDAASKPETEHEYAESNS